MHRYWLAALFVIGGLAVTAGQNRSTAAAPRRATNVRAHSPAIPTGVPDIYLQGLAVVRGTGGDGSATGGAATGFQIQNLDSVPAEKVAVQFVNGDGVVVSAVNLAPIAPGSAYNVYLPSEAKLPLGWYAARISSDRPVAAIARTEWAASGRAALFSSSAASRELYVPLVMRRYAGQSSVIRVQNTDANNTIIAGVQLWASGSDWPAFGEEFSIPAGGFITLDLANDPIFAGLPTPFVGALHMKTFGVPLAAMAYVTFEQTEKAAYAFEAIPADQAADRLFVPLFRSNFFGTTGISVVNPGFDPVDVTVQFDGSWSQHNRAACEGMTFTQGPVTITGGSSGVFYQAPGVNVPGTGTSPVPNDCAGSATITATGGKVLAVVNDASGNPAQPTTSAAYNAFSVDQGAKRVALPLYRNRHTAAQLTTGIQAMNIGTATAHVTISFTLQDGTKISGAVCGGACTQNTIAPGFSANWYPPSIGALPINQYGSAFIESDQPMAVIVNDQAMAGTMDAAIYNGIKVEGP